MTTPSNSADRPPLKTIDKSGTYVLRLCKPKPEKIKTNTAGFPTCNLSLPMQKVIALIKTIALNGVLNRYRF
jgi:hypothetical protein